jgi:amino acid adenylation domain-containing protein
MEGGEGAERAMGLFINTLPVRVRVGEEEAEGSVREMHGQLAELLRHEHASLALAQRCSGVAAPLPLFTSLLNYRHSGGRGKRGGGENRGGGRKREWEGVRGLYGEERSNYPLILSVDDVGEGFGLTVQVEKGMGAKRVCGYMHRALAGLVESLETAPRTQMRRLEVVPEEERRQLLYEWNGAVSSFPREKCVHELFEEQVERTPQALAASFLGKQLSYEQLNRKANQWARFLRQQTGGGNVMVGVCLQPSLEMVIVLLAVLKVGGTYVPLDAGYPRERLAFMARDARIRIVVTERKMLERLPLAEVTVCCVDGLELEEGCEQLSDSNLRVESVATSLAYVIYTSGSTGTPKGVGITHQGINRLVMNTDYVQLGPGDRVAQVSNLSFDALTFEVWGALLTGAAVVGIERDVTLDPHRFAQALEQQRITTMFVTTALFNQMAYLIPEAFSSLRELLFGGEAVDVKAVRRVLSIGPSPRLLHVYGPTESTTFATWHRVEGISEEADTVPIGRPINNTWTYVLDEYGQPVPVGVVGEIHIGGAGVGQGYLNRADLTAEKFVPDPYIEDGKESGARMYRTGDLARWRADHTIEFVRRNDHQVKVRGFRIELGEIEARLREHPGVREAVAMVREDALSDKQLVVYYTSTKAEAVKGAEELRTHLTARLPEYMVPAAYVRMEEMPLTQNGKLDRQALPGPESNAYGLQGYEPPQEGMETTMAGIWADVLKVKRVGRNDNFFVLGGHSLLVVKMVTLLKQAGIEISVSDVFGFPTIKSIAAKIASCNAPASSDAVIPIRESGTEPPLFLVHEGTGQLLYAHPLASCMDVEIPVYGLPAIPADEVQLKTVEQMAARMVRLIHSVQPNGPYRLAGWSFGGALAYEIAVQLIGAGHAVAFLGLLDAGYPPSINTLPAGSTLDFDDKEKLLLLAQRMATEHDVLQARFETLRTDLSAMSFESLVQKCQELSLLPDGFTGKTAAQVRNWLARVHAIGLAYGRYSPPQLSVPVHLFRAERETYASPTLGWNAVIPDDRLELIPISGTHLSMMESPNIQILGQALSRAIHNRVAARAGR